MPLIKRRPTIRLVAPREVVVGEPFEVSALIDCEEPVPARAIDFELEGLSVWYSATQRGRQRASSRFHSRSLRAWKPGRDGKLEAGEHTARGVFALPADVPPSYDGEWIEIEYHVKVRVEIPWWPDATASFQIHVAAPPRATAGVPAAFASNADGPVGRAAYFEISAATTTIVPRGQLDLAASASNVEYNNYQWLDIELFAIETANAWGMPQEHRRRIASRRVPIAQADEGERVTCSLPIPADVVAGFETDRVALRWELEVSAAVTIGVDPTVVIPLTVSAAAETDRDVRQLAPPAVGSERLALMWREAGEVLGFELRDGELSRDGGAIRIWREHRGRRGLTLCAEIALGDLGVGLAFNAGRGGRLAARDPGQQQRLRDALGSLLGAASVERADDRIVRCERRGSGARIGPLSRFVADVDRLACALDAERAAMPPPAAIAGEIDAWKRLAAAAGGQLEPAGPTIRGTTDRAAWSVAVGWDGDGEPRERVVRAVPPAPLDARHHGWWIAGDADEPDAELDRLCAGARSLQVTRDELVLALPIASVGLDRVAGAVFALVDRALELSRAPSAGVYR